jgi:hypothetical protein
MGLFSSGKKGKFREIPLTESQKSADALMKRLVEMQVSFPEREVAPLSDTERQAIQSFKESLGEEGLIGQARDVLGQTLRGEFDPRTSPFYQGLRDEAQRLKQVGVSDALRRGQRFSGGFSGVAGRQAGEVAGRADENILQVLGSLFETERGRQQQAVPTALGFEQGISGTLAGLGGLERSIEQQILDAQFQKQQQDVLAPFQYQSPVADALLKQQRFTYTPGKEGSSTMQDIMGVAGIAAAPFTGGASLGMTASALGGPQGGGMGGAGGIMSMLGAFPGMTNALFQGGGGLTSGIGSFLGGGGGLNTGPTSLYDINAGQPGMGGMGGFGGLA